MSETAANCEILAAEIARLQSEFEILWLAVSRGGTATPRYRELRHILDEMRARYASECGAPSESSDLPRSIASDWRAG